ncbi:MAG: hypothetical protein ABGY29_18575, partial [bacterium]
MKRTLSLVAFLGLAAVWSVALGIGQDATAAQGSAPSGKITGHIRFEGEKPKVKPLTVTAVQSVGCCPEGETV